MSKLYMKRGLNSIYGGKDFTERLVGKIFCKIC